MIFTHGGEDMGGRGARYTHIPLRRGPDYNQFQMTDLSKSVIPFLPFKPRGWWMCGYSSPTSWVDPYNFCTHFTLHFKNPIGFMAIPFNANYIHPVQSIMPVKFNLNSQPPLISTQAKLTDVIHPILVSPHHLLILDWRHRTRSVPCTC